jgi:hypothetical protein
MFDWFMSTENKIRKHQRRVTNRDTQPDEREQSVRWLLDEGSPKALRALLMRFDMTLPHQLNDKAEREHTYDLLLVKGDELLRPLRLHLKKCRGFAYPLRMFEEVTDAQQTIEMVYQLLRIEYEKDDLNHPEKKRNLLIWLAERKHAGAVEAVTPFLLDFDEGVRIAAIEVLLHQDEDSLSATLEGALCREDEDSNRIRVRVAQVFAQRGWSVADAGKVGAMLPQSYRLDGARVVASA